MAIVLAFWLKLNDMKKSYFYIFFLVAVLVLPRATYAALSSTVSTSCVSGVVVFRMSSTTNAHVELPSQSNYPQLVCASGVDGLSNGCSGNFKVVAKLSGETNAHVEQNDQSNYSNNACLSVPAGGSISIGYQDNNCSGFDTTLASMIPVTPSDWPFSNAHVGDANAYTRKICASASGPTSPTPPPPPPPSSGGGGGGGGGFITPPTPPSSSGGGTSLIQNPLALPSAGTYTTAQNIFLYAGTSTSIRYTVDDSIPSCSVGAVYTSAILMSSSKTIKAIACNLTLSSSVVSFTYIINSNIINSNQITPFIFTRDLKLGSVHEDVRRLQQFLNTHGFPVATSGPGSFGKETNRFGLATRAALAKFQVANSISPAVGYFGLVTRALVNGGAALPLKVIKKIESSVLPKIKTVPKVVAPVKPFTKIRLH